MPYKVGSLYCVTTQEPATVADVTDKKITVKYKSGKELSYPLGVTYGRMEGSVYKHTNTTDRIKGQQLKPGDYITYNDGFFEKDWLDPSRLVMKFSRNITVALTMSDEVYEDSSAISKEMSEIMSTPQIKEKVFVIEVNKNIEQLLPEGTKVTPNDILFTILDENTDYSNLSESSIEMLKSLSNISPKAKYNGHIFRYEVKYNADYSDMSPSIRKLVNRLDKETEEETKDTPYPVKNNRVNAEYRSEGKNLMPGYIELKVFIEFKVKQTSGNKGVFGSQMKSVIATVFNNDITTESGTKVDAMFSYRSILNRIVLSPILMGTTNRLIKHMSPKIAEVYFN